MRPLFPLPLLRLPLVLLLPMLAVMRFDDFAGNPLAILVNFAAHPVMTDNKVLKFSADYPGFLQAKVEADAFGGIGANPLAVFF